MTSFLVKIFLIPRALAEDIKLDNPLGSNTTFDAILKNILGWLLKAANIIVPIVIIFGAFQMIFANGQPEKFKTGQKVILYAVIGYIVVLLANGIADIVKNTLTGQ